MDQHKLDKKKSWKQYGLIMDNFDKIYERYVLSKNCEICGNEYKSSQDKQMDHNHETGEFRNIVCKSCNQKKEDVKIRTDNCSGYKGISRINSKRYAQGFTWGFFVYIDGNRKKIKSCTNLEKLKNFAEQWKKINNYHT